jgi:hypothetical protein
MEKYKSQVRVKNSRDCLGAEDISIAHTGPPQTISTVSYPEFSDPESLDSPLATVSTYSPIYSHKPTQKTAAQARISYTKKERQKVAEITVIDAEVVNSLGLIMEGLLRQLQEQVLQVITQQGQLQRDNEEIP